MRSIKDIAIKCPVIKFDDVMNAKKEVDGKQPATTGVQSIISTLNILQCIHLLLRFKNKRKIRKIFNLFLYNIFKRKLVPTVKNFGPNAKKKEI